jgi:rubrerythrin
MIDDLRAEIERALQEGNTARSGYQGTAPTFELLRRASQALEALTRERDALQAQFKGVGHVPYLDRMKELAHRAEKAEAERDALKAALADTKQRAERNAREALAKLRQRNAALADVTRLKAALEQVEWVEFAGVSICLWCGTSWPMDEPDKRHWAGCSRQLALSPRGEGTTTMEGILICPGCGGVIFVKSSAAGEGTTEAGWQPIETAPKNTPLLLWAPPERLWENPAGKDGEMRVSTTRDFTWATLWQPLPAAPGADGSSGAGR